MGNANASKGSTGFIPNPKSGCWIRSAKSCALDITRSARSGLTGNGSGASSCFRANGIRARRVEPRSPDSWAIRRRTPGRVPDLESGVVEVNHHQFAGSDLRSIGFTQGRNEAALDLSSPKRPVQDACVFPQDQEIDCRTGRATALDPGRAGQGTRSKASWRR